MNINLFITVPVVLFSISCRNSSKTASDALKNQSVEALETVLTGGQAWEKVHAAEFLIDLGDTGQVYDAFRTEWNRNGHIPEYRIGIWRVLSKCAGKDKKMACRDSIYQAFVLPTSPDRIHAAETLAKLKIACRNEDSAVIASALEDADERLSFYTHWWIIPQRENGLEKLKDHLFQIIQSNENQSIRKMAAYVLCEDQAIKLDKQEWQLMESVALCEPVDSDARLQLLAAAFSKATDESAPPASLQKIKKMMLEYIDSGKPTLYQLCLALARKGEIEDTDLLTPLLQYQEDDVKIAAAYAILKIDQQTSVSK